MSVQGKYVSKCKITSLSPTIADWAGKIWEVTLSCTLMPYSKRNPEYNDCGLEIRLYSQCHTETCISSSTDHQTQGMHNTNLKISSSASVRCHLLHQGENFTKLTQHLKLLCTYRQIYTVKLPTAITQHLRNVCLSSPR